MNTLAMVANEGQAHFVPSRHVGNEHQQVYYLAESPFPGAVPEPLQYPGYNDVNAYVPAYMAPPSLPRLPRSQTMPDPSDTDLPPWLRGNPQPKSGVRGSAEWMNPSTRRSLAAPLYIDIPPQNNIQQGLPANTHHNGLPSNTHISANTHNGFSAHGFPTGHYAQPNGYYDQQQVATVNDEMALNNVYIPLRPQQAVLVHEETGQQSVNQRANAHEHMRQLARHSKETRYRQALNQYILDERSTKDRSSDQKERLIASMEQGNYDPWGKGGGGAPMKDYYGNSITDRNVLHKAWSHDNVAKLGAADYFTAPRAPIRYASSYQQIPDGFQQPVDAYSGTHSALSRMQQNEYNSMIRQQQPPDDARAYGASLRMQMEENRRQKEYEKEMERMEDMRERLRLEQYNARIQPDVDHANDRMRRVEQQRADAQQIAQTYEPPVFNPIAEVSPHGLTQAQRNKLHALRGRMAKPQESMGSANEWWQRNLHGHRRQSYEAPPGHGKPPRPPSGKPASDPPRATSNSPLPDRQWSPAMQSPDVYTTDDGRRVLPVTVYPTLPPNDDYDYPDYDHQPELNRSATARQHEAMQRRKTEESMRLESVGSTPTEDPHRLIQRARNVTKAGSGSLGTRQKGSAPVPAVKNRKWDTNPRVNEHSSRREAKPLPRESAGSKRSENSDKNTPADDDTLQQYAMSLAKTRQRSRQRGVDSKKSSAASHRSRQ